jgi:hypothetical protein
VLLAMVALFELELQYFDINFQENFLHGKFEEQIYMTQPEDFVVQGKEDHICLLKKSLIIWFKAILEEME